MLQRAVFKIVAEGGIESVTVRKITEGCNLGSPYIYQCYADVPELLKDAYIKMDKEIAGLMHYASKLHVSASNKKQGLKQSTWILWSLYWDFLMKDAARTIFYWRFYQSGYYNKSLLAERQEYYGALIRFVQDTGQTLHIPSNINLEAIISNIIDDTVSVAVKTHLGYFDKSTFIPKLLYQSVFSLLFHLMGMDIWKEGEE